MGRLIFVTMTDIDIAADHQLVIPRRHKKAPAAKRALAITRSCENRFASAISISLRSGTR
jgi:hypothetical protein